MGDRGVGLSEAKEKGESLRRIFMRKYYLAILMVVCLCGVNAQSPQPHSSQALIPALSTNINTVAGIAASSSVDIGGAPILMWRSTGYVRISVSATGTAATTNGTLKIPIISAMGDYQLSTTNDFDSAAQTDIVIELQGEGAQRVTKSDFFDVTGIRYLKTTNAINTAVGPWSNVVVRIGFPK